MSRVWSNHQKQVCGSQGIKGLTPKMVGGGFAMPEGYRFLVDCSDGLTVLPAYGLLLLAPVLRCAQ